MQIVQTTFTIAEYCDQLEAGQIVVNRKYQRSPGIWPGPARSFLIDTILSGFPIPKFMLYQITDVKKRRTLKEIVDGQQRTLAISDFYEDKFKISGQGSWLGLRFSELSEEDQEKFVSYQLSCDLFVAASESDIREVFQRMNSYQVLLNRQEQRHARFQGAFKWFVLSLTVKYSAVLKGLGVMGERQFVRMADAALFTELIYALENGLESSSDKKLDALYKTYDHEFDDDFFMDLFDNVFTDILDLDDIHSTGLMKSYQFYSLFLAIAHVNYGPIEALQDVYKVEAGDAADEETQAFRLGQLATALEEGTEGFDEFLELSSEGSNRVNQRTTRFVWMCAALTNQPNPE